MNTMANQAMHSRRRSHQVIWKWIAGLSVSTILAACGGGGGGGDGGREPILGGGGVAELAPTVTAVVPIQNSIGVPTNTRIISAAFSKPMDPSTINAANFTLACSGAAASGTVTYTATGNIAILTLSGNLPANANCTGTVATGVRDVTGNALARPFVWSFSTGVAIDATAPTVSSTFPVNNAANVAVNSAVTVSFSEPMDPLSITSANIRLACPATAPITATVGYAVLGSVATLTPSSNLPANTVCTGTVTTAVRDVAGNPMTLPFVWVFTTGAAPDTTPPTVIATFPVSNATGVPVNSIVTATFSEAMNPLTITTANVKLVCPANTPVIGTVGYALNGSVMTFLPLTNLPASTICTATISAAVRDVAGNAMAADFVWSFTTGVAPDTTRPTVTAVVPRANAVGVATNTLVTASFSEPMNPLTITASTMTLSCPGVTPIVGTVGYSTLGNVATFTPTSVLPFNSVCTATVSNGVTDVAGNAMALPFVWSFTTSASTDVLPPTVISTVPVNGAFGVGVDITSSATFSEPMDPLTMTPATFRLACPTTNLQGGVTYSVAGNTVFFKPAINMPANTICTATITTGVRDTAGNAMLSNYVWQFTTQAPNVPPVIPPFVSPVTLGTASTYGGFGGAAGITNQGIFTVINGSIGTTAASTLVTGFHSTGPGCTYTETPLNVGLVTGAINTAAPPPTVACPTEGTAVTGAAAAAARAAALVAYNQLVAAPGGPDPGAGNLGGLTLAPGNYTAAGGTFMITGSDLTLDGQGNPNATWIFQMAATLTVGGPGAPRNVILINGAQAKNVFWQVGTAATINAAGGGTMVGTIIANVGNISTSTAGNVALVTVNGRLLSLLSSVTLVNTVINVPGP